MFAPSRHNGNNVDMLLGEMFPTIVLHEDPSAAAKPMTCAVQPQIVQNVAVCIIL